MGYVLGIDLGTSSLKGIVMNPEGQVIGEKSSEYLVSSPHTGYAEQQPTDWINACEEVLQALAAEIKDFTEKLEGISFSGQMHSLVVLDQANQPLYPAILWNDVRTSKQCQQIKNQLGSQLLRVTKNIPLEGFTLPKILWLQENEPEIWQQVAHVMLPKDYLRYWLTGKIATDYSDAAGTLLLDIEKQQWSEEISQVFNISKKVLPELISSLDEAGTLRSEIKESFGFKRDVTVFAGGADNACAALGAGLVDANTGLLSIGTSGVFSSYEAKIQDYEGKLHFFNHVLPNAYYSMGVTLAAGSSLAWFKSTFGAALSFEELLRDIAEIPVGSAGLLFTPYIAGERTPYFDSKIRGSFVGIDAQHRLPHFARAVLEGITFSLKDSQEILTQTTGKQFQRVISVGGGAKNSEWLQMQADILNTEILALKVEQGPSAGACMIAALGCGWFKDISSTLAVFVSHKQKRYQPDPQKVKAYQTIYRIWQQMYPNTKEICHALHDR